MRPLEGSTCWRRLQERAEALPQTSMDIHRGRQALQWVHQSSGNYLA